MRLRVLAVAAGSVFYGSAAFAEEAVIPALRFGLERARGPQDVALTLQIVFLLTVLTLAPAILLLLTSFTRIVVVLSFLRNALGTQAMPPNQVMVGLALFLTFFIMTPTWNAVYGSALRPYLDGQITQAQALEQARPPVQRFLLAHTREKDIALFVRLSRGVRPRSPQEVQLGALVPAFIISELRTAFSIGFLVYIPFIIIDIVVASVLMSMGMFMLPPMMVSLPFKLVFFVLIDGWHLVVGSLARSFLG
ncbi:MAG: flagellar type III secretion system pore protein FliP [Deltaproteobacteria bacterium]|nr:flagellar type III secretion system pore protein FliP [Deltaproteobacteria bacterium]